MARGCSLAPAVRGIQVLSYEATGPQENTQMGRTNYRVDSYNFKCRKL